MDKVQFLLGHVQSSVSLSTCTALALFLRRNHMDFLENLYIIVFEWLLVPRPVPPPLPILRQENGEEIYDLFRVINLHIAQCALAYACRR